MGASESALNLYMERKSKEKAILLDFANFSSMCFPILWEEIHIFRNNHTYFIFSYTFRFRKQLSYDKKI